MKTESISPSAAGPNLNEIDSSPAIFDERESAVRSYARSFPAMFTLAKGPHLTDSDGRVYVDFLSGAGTLSLGHNHERLKSALIDYISADGLTHGLDLHTAAKASFLREFTTRILEPRALDHRVQFTGPTGTNAVEAALKIARRATGRTNVISFMGGYHGHSLGSLAATANRGNRSAAGTPLGNTTFVPFPGGHTASIDSLAYLRMLLEDSHSGLDLPAAVILETVQAEGGVNIAPTGWLRELRELCTEHGMLLIVDDIQVGCGRTGTFFSFERAGIVPDVITLSKAISGYGLPMALTLVRPEYDLWRPGEHTGTFRGNQLAFVTAAAALRVLDEEGVLARVSQSAAIVEERLQKIAAADPRLSFRGLGMIWGLDTAEIDPSGELASRISSQCFTDGLIVETAGRSDTVLKLLPPLNIREHDLTLGLEKLARATMSCIG